MTCGERFKAEDCLKFHQVLSPGLSAAAVLRPTLNGNLELAGYKMKQRSKRQLVHAEHDAGKTKVTELHGETQPVSRAAALPNDGKIGLTQGVASDQVVSAVGQGKQALPLGGGKDRTTGHNVPLGATTPNVKNRTLRLRPLPGAA